MREAFITGIIILLTNLVTNSTPIIESIFRDTLSRYLTNTVIEERLNVIAGKYKGTINQEGLDGAHHVFPFEASLEAKGNIVTGIAILNYKDKNYELTLKGHCIDRWYVKINFENRNRQIIHEGCIYLKLSACGKVQNARFLGYGFISDGIISGKINFEKFTPLLAG